MSKFNAEHATTAFNQGYEDERTGHFYRGSQNYATPSNIVASVDAWYDRSLKLWTCLWLDAEGNQLGPAQYAPRRNEMKQTVAWMKTSIGEEMSVIY